MSLFVAEIAGRGVVAYEAADADEARALLADRALLRDLCILQNEGRPLWDGTSEINLREALAKGVDFGAHRAGRACNTLPATM